MLLEDLVWIDVLLSPQRPAQVRLLGPHGNGLLVLDLVFVAISIAPARERPGVLLKISREHEK